MNTEKIYHVKCLDLKYLGDFSHINLKYLTYEVSAESEEQAVKKAQVSYMRGEKEKFEEEIPFLLKLFSVSSIEETKNSVYSLSKDLCGSLHGPEDLSEGSALY